MKNREKAETDPIRQGHDKSSVKYSRWAQHYADQKHRVTAGFGNLLVEALYGKS